jgi:hypothetical protein
MDETDATFSPWILTLPGMEGAAPEDDTMKDYLDPDTWPGEWKHFQNANMIGVRAGSEAEARQICAEADCDIWLDPLYARCRGIDAVKPDEPGVIFMVRGGADNE